MVDCGRPNLADGLIPLSPNWITGIQSASQSFQLFGKYLSNRTDRRKYHTKINQGLESITEFYIFSFV